MIINSGLGDDSIPVDSTEASFNWSWLGLGLGILVLFQISHGKRTSGRAKRQLAIARKRPAASRAEPKASSTESEVISALVGQGAGKTQAKNAVSAARSKGASGFEGLFRGALKEL